MVTKYRRYWQIADVLFRYEFGSIVQRLFPGTFRFRRCKTCPVETVSSVYERMRLAIEELGPTYVKLGQILSTRQDILPPELIHELKKLQDQVAPLPFSEIKKVLDASCPDHEECFSFIDETPLASASIAQVHRATLRDGRNVVLKVQRPGISGIIETDIVILESFAKRIERSYPEYRVYNPRGIVADFADQIRKELDFVRDGRNADRLRNNMKPLAKVRVPKIIWEHSSRQVLVMDYIDGVRVDHVDEIRGFGVNPEDIADLGFTAYMRQIFEDGFFHGDPHPGNLLVSRDGTLNFLDFGIVGVIPPDRRYSFIEFLYAIVIQDPDLLINAMEHLGIEVTDEDREDLRDDIYQAMLEAEGGAIGEYSFKSVNDSLTAALRRYQVVMPKNLMLMFKVLVMVLDVGVTLDPGFNFLDRADPYITRLSRRELLENRLIYGGGHALVEAVDGFLETPRNLNRMLRRFSTGKVKVDILDSDILRLQEALDRTSDKLLIGLIVAGVVVGSSLVLTVANVQIPSFVFYLAALVYVVAIVIGLYSIWHALAAARKRRDQ